MSIQLYKEVDSRIVEVLKYDASIYAILLSKIKEAYHQDSKGHGVSKSLILQLLGHAKKFGFYDSKLPEHFDRRPFIWLWQYAKSQYYI